MSFSSTRLALLTIAAAFASTSQVNADLFGGNVDPFNRNNKLGRYIRVPRFPVPGTGSGGPSTFSATSPPYIDSKGLVWSGVGNTSARPRYVGKAQKQKINGACYWVSNYSDIYGKPTSRRTTCDQGSSGVAFITNNGTRFTTSGGGIWIETGRDGTRHRYRQVNQSAGAPLLYDANRSMYVQLKSGWAGWSQSSRGPFRPWPGSNGRWSTQ